MKRLVLFSFVMILVLAFSAGCASPEDTGADTGTAGEGADQGALDTGESQQAPGFAELSQKSLSGLRITYDIEYDAGLGDGQATFTQYFGEGKNMRTDYTIEQGGEETKARVYETEDGTTTCMMMSGEWKCFTADISEYTGSTPAQEKAASQQEQVEKNPQEYDISFDGTRTIVGETAYCFRTDLEEQGRTMKHCFLKSGVPAYFESQGPDESYVMEAVSMSSDVSSSDFEFPAEPVDLSSTISSAVSGDDLSDMQESLPDMG